MVRFLVGVTVLGGLMGCVTVLPTSVQDSNDIVVRNPHRNRAETRSVIDNPIREIATMLEPDSNEEDLEAAPLEADMLPVVPDEPEQPEAAKLRTWREIVAELERSDLDALESNPVSELTLVMTSMPAEAPDFVEATCRASRWMEDEWQIMRAISEVRRRAGSDVRKLYGSLRSTSNVDCTHADVASFRLALGTSDEALLSAARVGLEGARRMRRFGAGTTMDLRQREADVRVLERRSAREVSGLRTEVAAALPHSLELSNLDEIIYTRCMTDDDGVGDEDDADADDADADEEKTCVAPSLDTLAQLVKVRTKALGAKHADVAAARLRYARTLLASSDAKQRSLGEKQLRKILTDAAPGSTPRVLATAHLIVALRIRQSIADALVLERAFVNEVASPTSDRQVTLVGEAAATIATIAMSEHRDDDAYAVLKSLMKAYAISPLDSCGAENCDVRAAQIEMLEEQATIQPVRAYEIEQRIAEIRATIEASDRVR